MNKLDKNIILLVTWIGILLIILTLSILQSNQIITITLILLHSIVIIIFLMRARILYSQIIIYGLILRIVFMLWDLYGRDIFIFPNSGGDAEGFFYCARLVQQDISYIFEPIYGGLYVKLNGVLFALVGTNRILSQYINVLFGLSTLIVIYGILKYINLDKKTFRRVLMIAAFFPNSLIMSAIFIREIMITFFISLSIYYFVKWFINSKNIDILLALILLGIASALHSGVIAIFLGYAFAILFYKHNIKKFKFDINTILLFTVMVISVFMIFTYFQDIFLVKFKNVESIQDVYTSANTAYGDSKYLTSLKINNPIELIMYGPIRALYFLSAPVPFDWRGLLDILTFILDSLFYIIVLWKLFKYRKSLAKYKYLIIILLVITFSISMIFGIGVSNAGTAMRHRQKFITIFLLLYALTISGRERESKAKDIINTIYEKPRTIFKSKAMIE